MLKGKRILITGGTGSFGSTFVKRLLSTDAEEVRIFSRDEKKQDDMRNQLKESRLKYFIGDVRLYTSVDSALYGVDYVFHAAALKQVPSCEFYPIEAVRTNILGTDNVIRASVSNGVKRLVVLSTDKAVYPINAMGQTKALAEKLMVSASRSLDESNTTVCGTRYGNVMASRGSVIPLFISQLKEGRPLTVTDPSMTRFMMSLEDSVDLVLHAFQHGQNGDIFVQKAPSATVKDVAQALREIFESKSEVQVIGTRHGEKLYETLVSREEMVHAVDQGKFYRLPADTRDLDYEKYYSDGEESISEQLDYTSHNAERLGVDDLKRLLMKLDHIKAQLGDK